MINAHIEMNLNDHVVITAMHVLELLKEKDGASVAESLMKDFLKKYDDYTPDQFFDSIIFLYSLGFIDTHEYRIVVTYV